MEVSQNSGFANERPIKMVRQLKKSVKQVLLGAAFGLTALGATYHLGQANGEKKADPYMAKLDEMEERAVEDLRHASGMHISHTKNEEGDWTYFDGNGQEVELSGEEEREYTGFLLQEESIRAQFEVERDGVGIEAPVASKKIALVNK